ncbi:MAG: hypothetical protein ACRDTG_21750 [Pseudonocardiaceae bacterium]
MISMFRNRYSPRLHGHDPLLIKEPARQPATRIRPHPLTRRFRSMVMRFVGNARIGLALSLTSDDR